MAFETVDNMSFIAVVCQQFERYKEFPAVTGAYPTVEQRNFCYLKADHTILRCEIFSFLITFVFRQKVSGIFLKNNNWIENFTGMNESRLELRTIEYKQNKKVVRVGLFFKAAFFNALLPFSAIRFSTCRPITWQ